MRGTVKILREREERVAVLDVEIGRKIKGLLIDYAFEHMGNDEWDNVFTNWALVDILKKHVEREEENVLREGKQKAKQRRTHMEPTKAVNLSRGRKV